MQDWKEGYQVTFPAPKAEGKDHEDQGNLVSGSGTEGKRNAG